MNTDKKWKMIIVLSVLYPCIEWLAHDIAVYLILNVYVYVCLYVLTHTLQCYFYLFNHKITWHSKPHTVLGPPFILSKYGLISGASLRVDMQFGEMKGKQLVCPWFKTVFKVDWSLLIVCLNNEYNGL